MFTICVSPVRSKQGFLGEIRYEIIGSSLLTDPKSRKVILVEHPLLPLYIKEIMARILFNNLQVCNGLPTECLIFTLRRPKVPSISFASSHLLSLLAVGRITGLVLDCGHLESTALPVSINLF